MENNFLSNTPNHVENNFLNQRPKVSWSTILLYLALGLSVLALILSIVALATDNFEAFRSGKRSFILKVIEPNQLPIGSQYLGTRRRFGVLNGPEGNQVANVRLNEYRWGGLPYYTYLISSKGDNNQASTYEFVFPDKPHLLLRSGDTVILPSSISSVPLTFYMLSQPAGTTTNPVIRFPTWKNLYRRFIVGYY